MGEPARNGSMTTSSQQYSTLLEVAEAIVSQRDLQALFHDLAGRLPQVVPFDYLILVLHDADSNTMRRQILESREFGLVDPLDADIPPAGLRIEEGPSGWVWQAQESLLISNLAEET